jgi:hypothetical protein
MFLYLLYVAFFVACVIYMHKLKSTLNSTVIVFLQVREHVFWLYGIDRPAKHIYTLFLPITSTYSLFIVKNFSST